MDIKVRYIGILSKNTGTNMENVTLEDGSTIGELLSLLDTKYGPAFHDARKSMLVVVNGKSETTRYKLKNQDSIAFLRPMLGG